MTNIEPSIDVPEKWSKLVDDLRMNANPFRMQAKAMYIQPLIDAPEKLSKPADNLRVNVNPVNSHGEMDPNAALVELKNKLNSIAPLPMNLRQLNARNRFINRSIYVSLLCS